MRNLTPKIKRREQEDLELFIKKDMFCDTTGIIFYLSHAILKLFMPILWRHVLRFKLKNNVEKIIISERVSRHKGVFSH